MTRQIKPIPSEPPEHSQGEPAHPIPSNDGGGTHELPKPFTRTIRQQNPGFIVDDILPPSALLEFVSVDVLNCYINYVDLRAVITERDPEEEERHISMSNRFYTHFHEFGTVIHVIASSAKHWWYFCYDIDASDCALGRVEIGKATLQQMKNWVMADRISARYPVTEIEVRHLQGWRSFQ